MHAGQGSARQERCTVVHILPCTGKMAELTSNSCSSYKKSPALGLTSTCKGIRRAARTAFMSPAQGQQSLQHPALAQNCMPLGLQYPLMVHPSYTHCSGGLVQHVPALGVRPPQERPQQSSTRAAPAVWAESADDRESTQNSTAMPALGAGATMG